MQWNRKTPLNAPPTVTSNKVLINIHLVVCLMTGPKPLPNRALHIVRSRASSFKWEFPFLSLRSSSSFLHLLLRLPVTSIPPFIFRSITCCRRQSLRKMWPLQLGLRLLISCKIFLCSLTLSNTSHLCLSISSSFFPSRTSKAILHTPLFLQYLPNATSIYLPSFCHPNNI